MNIGDVYISTNPFHLTTCIIIDTQGNNMVTVLAYSRGKHNIGTIHRDGLNEYYKKV